MFKKYKNYILIGLLVLIGASLILLGSVKTKEVKSDELKLSKEYIESLEKKIEDFLLTVEGIRRVNVIITLDTSSEKVYAQNQSTLDIITINSSGGESPVYVTEIYPTVRGIAISCTNGDNADMRIKLTKLISAYLGISSNRIEIVGLG